MEKFTTHTGKVVPLDRPNVDTDQIIPAVHLKRIERTGFGRFLFASWRKDPSFVLNRPEYAGASILVAGDNFGCGSSREHAPWALLDHGFRVVIAPSFADIFYNNSFKNGLLLATLPPDAVRTIVDWATGEPGFSLMVDLERQTVSDGRGLEAQFEIDPFRKHCLLNGLDDIGLTLGHEADIAAFEARRPAWLPTTTARSAAR
ncbi:MAG TPA: 3-isopropylmalate dehydratase small subunit [Chloroflexota bacterium]|nr:3-isopropylmalate dehydratase small subunit [Chloroflexota bacterium]